jgi:hypothetical protein
MVVTPTVGARQGINALKNGIQIGGTTILAGSGTPNAAYAALRIGDLYVDYTNAILYMATATGSASWVPLNGASVGLVAHGADMNTAPIPTRIGNLLINTVQGKLYVAGAVSATSDWKLVTSA